MDDAGVDEEGLLVGVQELDVDDAGLDEEGLDVLLVELRAMLVTLA